MLHGGPLLRLGGRRCSWAATGADPSPTSPTPSTTPAPTGPRARSTSDESNDRIKVSTTDGSNFAPGKTVRIDATVWAWTTPGRRTSSTCTSRPTPTARPGRSSPRSRRRRRARRRSPRPTRCPRAALQAVRARFRYQGSGRRLRGRRLQRPRRPGLRGDQHAGDHRVRRTTSRATWAGPPTPTGPTPPPPAPGSAPIPRPRTRAAPSSSTPSARPTTCPRDRWPARPRATSTSTAAPPRSSHRAITLPATGTLTLTFQYYLAHGSNATNADFFRASVVVGATATQVFQSLGARRQPQRRLDAGEREPQRPSPARPSGCASRRRTPPRAAWWRPAWTT